MGQASISNLRVITGVTRGLTLTAPIEPLPVSPEFRAALAFQGLFLPSAGVGMVLSSEGLEARRLRRRGASGDYEDEGRTQNRA